MPKFRDYEQKEIVISIQETVRTLSALKLGPATQAVLAPWRSRGESLKAVAGAKDDASLAAAVHGTRALWVFGPFAPLLNRLVRQENASEKLVTAHSSMVKWGALDGSHHLPVNPVHDEVSTYIATHNLPMGKHTAAVAKEREGGSKIIRN